MRLRIWPLSECRLDHPLYILFSGTTGKPKCLVHRQGGPLVKHLVEHALNGDNKPGDVTFFAFLWLDDVELVDGPGQSPNTPAF